MTPDTLLANLHARTFEAAADMLKAVGASATLTAAADAANNAVDHVVSVAGRVSGVALLDIAPPPAPPRT